MLLLLCVLDFPIAKDLERLSNISSIITLIVLGVNGP